ncbi:MAG TPA: cytochrome c [Bryobacteraceae bacterium]|nr:cytochrome c [Bryobacteraceae bacterium]
MSEGNATGVNRIRAWVLVVAAAAVSTAALAGGRGDTVKGKAVFHEQCAVCHHSDSAAKIMGPGLKGLFKHEKMGDGRKPTEANVRAKIDGGSTTGMPSYKDTLSDAEKDDLIAYLKTL